jgi:hypothetical protein
MSSRFIASVAAGRAAIAVFGIMANLPLGTMTCRSKVGDAAEVLDADW